MEFRVHIFKNGVLEKVEVEPYVTAGIYECTIYDLQPSTEYFIELTAHTADPSAYSDAISANVITSKYTPT